MSGIKKAIVTGGAGFVGSHVVDALIKEGFAVSVIDDLSGGKRENVHQDATLHVVDVRDSKAIAPIIAGSEFVFHLAALPRVQYSIEYPEETNSVNVGGTLAVLKAAKDAGVKRVVYAASSSAYGNQEILPLSEDAPPQPLSPYALQKYVGELYCRVFSDVYGLPTVSTRFFNVYGPRLDPEGAYALVIGKFLKQKKEGIPLTITGDGEQTRDFTHVRDIVRGMILAAKSEKVGKGEIINLGRGQETSVNAIAELIGGAVTHIDPRLEPRHTRADIRRAKELLNWEPEVSLDEGVAELKKLFGV
ncbi:NAD-dependent epimerase/dehydratase family protein [Patescibacteria group bacterium]|nr:MAG: NAD-dependent epimerase/dehydratase family protein [Patescibacteria group bacterium]